MSRKSRRQKAAQQHQGQEIHKFRVPLEEWLAFKRFSDVIPNLKEAVDEMVGYWQAHLNYLREDLQIRVEYSSDNEPIEDMGDTIKRISDLVGIATNKGHYTDGRPKKKSQPPYFSYDDSKYRHGNSNSYQQQPKKKKVLRWAEILIEDISDGKI